MTRIIQTASGSVYELDEDNMRIRRTGGVGSGQGIGYEWRNYENVSVVGGSLAVMWQTADGLVQSLRSTRIVKWGEPYELS